MAKIETPEEFCRTIEGIVGDNWRGEYPDWSKIYEEWRKHFATRDAAILREVADAGEAELFELTRPYREQMANCQAKEDQQGYDHAYRVVQDMGNGGHAYVRAIRKLLKEHAAIVKKE